MQDHIEFLLLVQVGGNKVFDSSWYLPVSAVQMHIQVHF